MIEVRNLVKKYDNHLALDNLSFTVEENTVFGFLGPNGAGKSTTMNIITGYLAPTSGQVLINGYDIVESPVEAKKYIGYLPELPPVYMDMTPYEYLKFVGQAKKIEKNRLKAEIEKAMDKANITHVQNRLIKTLSKGYRQRVGMAQAILGDPKVIILDEPTVGLDPMQIIEFRELVRELGKEHTVILSSHILAEISEICQKIMIISKGNLIAIDTPDNLSHQLEGGSLTIIKVREDDADRACEILRGIDGAKEVSVTGREKGLASIEIKGAEGVQNLQEQISVALMEGKCPVMAIEEKEDTLEDIFIKILDRQKAESAAKEGEK